MTLRNVRTFAAGASLLLALTMTGCDAGPLLFPSPSEAVEIAGDVAAAEAGSTVEVGSILQLTDRYGNPAAGARVDFRVVAGGGSLAESFAVADDEGRVVLPPFTLDTIAGVNRVEFQSADRAVGEVTIEGRPGPLDALRPLSSWVQAAPVAGAVPDPPTVEAVDRFGNAIEGVQVRFRASEGSVVTPTMVVTDSLGRARVDRWAVGCVVSDYRLEVMAGNAQTDFTAQAELLPGEPAPICVHSVHLNQGSQTAGGTIDLVAGRDALLRVFVTSPEVAESAPEALIDLFSGGELVDSHRVAAGSNLIHPNVDLERLDRSWNVIVPGSLIRAGFSVRVTLDPDGLLPDENRGGFLFPGGDGTLDFAVREIPPMDVVLIPVRQAVNGLEGRIDNGNADVLLELTRRLFPLDELSWRVRAPYTTQVELLPDSVSRWALVAHELLAVRTDEETGSAFYYGVAQVSYTAGVAGIGFVPPDPSHPARVALGWDHEGTAPWVTAHELGHTLGRRHSNCGGVGNPDPNAPPGGSIRSPGWDIHDHALRPTGELRDVMSYCRPEWVSDYTFSGILDWMGGLPSASGAFDGASAPRATSGILVWGRLGIDGVHLEPAFPSEGPAVLPERPGSDRIVGYAEDGEILFDLSFDGTPIAHSPDPDERHFAFRVPLTTGEQARLHRVELRHGEQIAVRQSGMTPADRGALDSERVGLAARRIDPRMVRVEWDPTDIALAVVRDRSGSILALARGGIADVFTPDAAVEVLLSDGVGSRRFEIETSR